MFTDSGTGDQAAAVFYTVAALPSPGRYSLRGDIDAASSTDNARCKIYLNSVEIGTFSAPNLGGHGSDSRDLLLSDGDDLGFSVDSAGVQSYTWQVEFRLCRMPEDIIP